MNIYKPAGFRIRLGASLLDYMIVSVHLLLPGFGTATLSEKESVVSES